MQEVTLKNVTWVCDFPGGCGPARNDGIEISAGRSDRLLPLDISPWLMCIFMVLISIFHIMSTQNDNVDGIGRIRVYFKARGVRDI